MIHLLLAVIYLAFMSLGLPDSLLGAAWPSMYRAFGVPVSCAGVISAIISLGTALSSLQSDRLTKRLGTGRVTVFSVALTAVALWGFSTSTAFWQLCLWAVPYGLGAGSVDASLNNYVALHYASRHMSWLHCMWGIGAALGPYGMGYALAGGMGWETGYRWICFLQIGITILLALSLPFWKRKGGEGTEEAAEPIPLRTVVRLPGVKWAMVAFFCYCGVEQTAALWASSYLVLHCGVTPGEAAGYAGVFFIGITLGRAASGFLTARVGDAWMVRLGQGIAAAGAGALLLPLGKWGALGGLALVGLGCAPIYPSLIHATPDHFGAGLSPAVIGVQMAAAYVGICAMPPLFGLLTQYGNVSLLPVYLLSITGLMVFGHEKLLLRRRG